MRAPSLLRPEPGPDTLKETRWGGHRLAELRGGPEHRGRAIGESWELSTLPGRQSRARGEPLGALLGAPLPFLAKLIDTALPLSVQLHPDDDAHGPGKEEAWMILDAEPGARLWAGLASGVERAHLEAAVRRGDDPRDLLTAIPALPGAVLLIPARTVHAIGGGVLLAEIQQPSDRTLRLFDYGSGRDLHIDAALHSLDERARPRLWRPGDPPGELHGKHLRLHIDRGPGARAHRHRGAPHLLTVLQGRCRVDGELLRAGDLGLLVGDATLDLEADALIVLGGAR